MTEPHGRATDADGEPAGVYDYGSALRDGHARVCVWGLGYIGWSTVEALREAGVRTLGFDVSESRVAQLRAAAGIEADLTLTADRQLTAADDVAVHFVAVPTEREAAPYSDAMAAVVTALVDIAASRGDRDAGLPPPLVVIESTLTPGTVDDILLPLLSGRGLQPDRDLLIALAPRRDWFLAEGYGLRELDRVFGGVGDRSATAAHGVLSLMCDRLHRATDHRVGELVKCVENAFRHVEITLANQLTLAFPHVNMVEVLQLAGTKWNMGTYHPSFGTGGYCVPLASRYLLLGAAHREELSLLSSAVETDDSIRETVAEAAGQRGEVLVLGLAYKGGIKVATLSPALAITARLRKLGIPHTLHDPMYTCEEIDALTAPGTAVADPAEAVRRAATVLIVADHPEFRTAPYTGLLASERPGGRLILDNYGVLEGHEWPGHVTYRRAGGPGWLDRNVAAEAGAS
ncbi:UDP binding domain-containing protein [Streptomyces sp. NPDC000987]|uniref:UDP binding domain-containing protein n=1 Tax=Streptomyces sp. NPDC000987 TaxID=3154374 RepID=UPI0033176115